MSRLAKVALRRLNKLDCADIDEAVEDSYSRSQFGYGWKDLDSDGQDERAEALITWHRPGKSKAPVEFATDKERRVVTGRWQCRFTGEVFTSAGDLDIDHIVPLKNAWLSGAHAWDKSRREQYSNGFGIRSRRRSWLLPVSASANRSKGARSPDEWMPENERYWVRYAALWVRTKEYWGLSVTPSEKAFLREVLESEA